ncbi:MAG: hypothetical protein ACRCTT_18640, partial [Enterobacter roggenkampii]
MTLIELKNLINTKLGTRTYIDGMMNVLRFHYRGNTYRVTTDLNVEKLDGLGDDARQLEKLLRGEQWDGTGLPPVGMKLEWKSEKYGWLGGTVAAHDAKYSGIAIIRHNDGYTGCHSHELRTAEMRIRSAAIEQML